jgi:hypothetical protein
MSTWTQPICDDCWVRQNGARVPSRVADEYRETEQCAFCGRMTRAGIYVRQDPTLVKFARKGDDDG